MKAFVQWLYSKWDECRGKIRGVDYGVAEPRMNQDWDLFTDEEWLLANPILLPTVYTVGDVPHIAHKPTNNRAFDPSETEYFLRVQHELLTSFRLHCQGFYLRTGVVTSSNSLQAISSSPLNQPHYFKCNTIVNTPFSKIPDDILIIIFIYLDPTSISHIEQTHPRFANLLRGPLGSSIWRRFCLTEELVSKYPDGMVRSLHTPEFPLSCDWRRFYLDAAESENVMNLKRIMGMADTLIKQFSETFSATQGLDNEEASSDDKIENHDSQKLDGEEDLSLDSDGYQFGQNPYKVLLELLNDACHHNDEILVDAYVSEIIAIENETKRKELLASYLKQVTEGRMKKRFKRLAKNHPEALAEFTPESFHNLAATVGSYSMLKFYLKEFSNQGNLGEAMKLSKPEFARKIWELESAAPIDISLALSGPAIFDSDLLEQMLKKLPDEISPDLKRIILQAMGRLCLSDKFPCMIPFLTRFSHWIDEPCDDGNMTLLGAAV
ncbi:hypothetical protein HDU99_005736, partial [Rhizoclosmatium hyalinum]